MNINPQYCLSLLKQSLLRWPQLKRWTVIGAITLGGALLIGGSTVWWRRARHRHAVAEACCRYDSLRIELWDALPNLDWHHPTIEVTEQFIDEAPWPYSALMQLGLNAWRAQCAGANFYHLPFATQTTVPTPKPGEGGHLLSNIAEVGYRALMEQSKKNNDVVLTGICAMRAIQVEAMRAFLEQQQHLPPVISSAEQRSALIQRSVTHPFWKAIALYEQGDLLLYQYGNIDGALVAYQEALGTPYATLLHADIIKKINALLWCFTTQKELS